jgi:hypothetical protein
MILDWHALVYRRGSRYADASVQVYVGIASTGAAISTERATLPASPFSKDGSPVPYLARIPRSIFWQRDLE